MSTDVSSPPVMVLSFAPGEQYNQLDLRQEENAIRQSLRHIKHSGRLEWEIRSQTTFEQLLTDLLDFRDRVAVIHYAGHADGQGLSFMGGDASPEKLANLLRHFRGLKLVFLNGCATRGFVDALLAAQVPAVIATQRPVGNQAATQMAARFFEILGNVHQVYTVQEAFEMAYTLEESAGTYREGSTVGLTQNRDRWGTNNEKEPDLPWGLYWREGNRAGVDWAVPPKPAISEASPIWRARVLPWGLGLVAAVLAIYFILDLMRPDSSIQPPAVSNSTQGDNSPIINADGDVNYNQDPRPRAIKVPESMRKYVDDTTLFDTTPSQ